MFIDYYSILEISPSSTKEEIKSAYKKQAKKWHPDKNHGQDTTKKMQEINEAYLILNDDEARCRYDIEYTRFINFQNAKKKSEEKKQEKTSSEQSQRQQSKQPEEEQKQEWTEEKSYKFDDEILKRWMENAKKQAAANIKDMIIEFRDSSIIGFGTFFSTAFFVIIKYVIFAIIMSIIFYFISRS